MVPDLDLVDGVDGMEGREDPTVLGVRGRLLLLALKVRNRCWILVAARLSFRWSTLRRRSTLSRDSCIWAWS